MNSLYTKGTRSERVIASGVKVGGETMRLPLNRDLLVAEHKVNVSVSQPNTGTDPNAVDVRDFISTVALETSDGRRVFLTGAQAYDLARFTESGAKVTSTLNAATCLADYSFELHHENDEARLDLLTALRSNELTTCDLVLTFAPDSANGFKNGTSPGIATYNVNVESQDFDMLDSVQFGEKLGRFKHYAEKQEVTGTTTGQQADISLATGNQTRFVMIHAYDTSGAVPVLSNAIVGNLRLNINGRDYLVKKFTDLQKSNVSKRGFDQTGVACIDFGDDEAGWLNLENVAQAKLQWDVLTGAPVSYRVAFAQDFTRKN